MDRFLAQLADQVRSFTTLPVRRPLKVVVEEPVSPHTTQYVGTLRQYIAKVRCSSHEVETLWQLISGSLDAHHQLTGSEGAFIGFLAVGLCRALRAHVYGLHMPEHLSSNSQDAQTHESASNEMNLLLVRLHELMDAMLGDTQRLCVKRRCFVSLSDLANGGFGDTGSEVDPLIAALDTTTPPRTPMHATPSELGERLASEVVGVLGIFSDVARVGALVKRLSLDELVAQLTQAVRVVPVLRVHGHHSVVKQGVCILVSDEGLPQSYLPPSWATNALVTGRQCAPSAVVLLHTWTEGVPLDLSQLPPQHTAVVVVDETISQWHIRWAESTGICVVGNVGREVIWRLALLLDLFPFPDVYEPHVVESPFDCPVHGFATPAMDVVDGVLLSNAPKPKLHRLSWTCTVSIMLHETGISEDHVSHHHTLRSVVMTVQRDGMGSTSTALDETSGGQAAWLTSVSVVVCTLTAALQEQLITSFWSTLHRLVGLARSGFAVPGGGFTEAVWLSWLSRKSIETTPSYHAVVALDALKSVLLDYVVTLRTSWTAERDADEAHVSALLALFRDFWTDEEWAELTPPRGPAAHCIIPVPPLQHVTTDETPTASTVLLSDVERWDRYDERVLAMRRAVDLCGLLCRCSLVTLIRGADGTAPQIRTYM